MSSTYASEASDAFATTDVVSAALSGMCSLVTREVGKPIWARPCVAADGKGRWWEIACVGADGHVRALASGTYAELLWLWMLGPEEMHLRLFDLAAGQPCHGSIVPDMPEGFERAVRAVSAGIRSPEALHALHARMAGWAPNASEASAGETGHGREWWRDVAEAMTPAPVTPVPDFVEGVTQDDLRDGRYAGPGKEADAGGGCPEGECIPLECHPEIREAMAGGEDATDPQEAARAQAIDFVEEHLTYSGWRTHRELFSGCAKVETAFFAVRGREIMLVSVSVPGDGVTLRQRLAGLEYDLSSIRSFAGDGFVAGAQGVLFIVDSESVLRAGRLEWDLVLDRWHSEEDGWVYEGGMPDWDAEPDEDDPFWEPPTTPVKRTDRHEVFELCVPDSGRDGCDCGADGCRWGCDCDDDGFLSEERCGCWGCM